MVEGNLEGGYVRHPDIAINSSGLAQPKGERNLEFGYGEKWLRQRVIMLAWLSGWQ